MDLFKLVGKFVIEGADQAGKDIDNITKKGDLSGTAIGKASEKVGKAVKTAMVASGAAMGAFAVTSVKTGTEFQAAMSEVAAISGASDDQLKLLSDTAKKMGSTTQFSATEAAEALKYMSLAGWDAETSTNALGGVLSLAAASGMDLAAASDMVTDYMSAFGMEASQSAYFADMLAYAQSHSNTTTEQLGEAFRNCAANMNAAGQDVETVTSMLEAMANQGLKGSEAGTALTAVMRDITSKMKDGAITIGNTSVSVTDANGNFRDMTDIMKDVESATNGMGDAQRASALASTFTADSIKGMNLILNEGVDQIAGYEAELRKSSGTADDMAATMNDNVAGAVKGMQSAFEGAQIAFFECFSDDIKAAIDKVAEVIRKITEKMPEFDEKLQSVKNVLHSIDFAGIASTLERFSPLIAGIVGGIVAFNAAMGVYNTIQAVSKAIQAAKIAMNLTETATLGALVAAEWAAIAPMAAIAAAVAVVIAIGVLLYKNWDTIKEKCGELKNAMSEKWNSIKAKTSETWQNVKQTMSDKMSQANSYVKGKLDNIKSAYEQNGGGIKGIAAATMSAVKQYYSVGYDAINALTGGKLGEMVSKVQDKMNSIKQAFSDKMNAAKDAVSNAMNAIKGLFSGELKFPHIKMPHFSISGEFSLKPPSVPHLSVDWYANGGIMTQPTLFDYNPMTGAAKVGGEAGNEAILPLQGFYDHLDKKLDEKNNGTINLTLRIDSFINQRTEDIQELAERISDEIEAATKRKGAVFA